MNLMLRDHLTKTKPLGASIEVTAKQALEYSTLREEIPVGTEVYLPDMGGDTAVTSQAAARLASMGYSVVLHLAARRIASIDALESRLRDLSAQAGSGKVLVIAGDQPKAVGPFASTMDVLKTGLLEEYGFNDIRVAGHPEGSPHFGDDAALEALYAKIMFCRRTGAKLTIVTQFSFDTDAVVRWCQKLHDAGIDAPVIIGVTGPARVATLIKYAALCGVKNSTSFLMKHAAQISNVMKSRTSEPLVRILEDGLSRCAAAQIRNIHIFAFGGIRNSSEWLLERGSWTIRQD